MSLEELEGIALQSNPALGQALARVEAAQGGWVQTGLPPNPVIGYSGQQLGSGGEAEQQGVFLGQEIVTGKKLKLNREAASWEVDRAEREFESVQLRVLTDVRIGYYEVLIAQRRRELATELVRISDKGVEAAEALLEGMEVGEADPLRARVEAETAGIFLQTATNQHTQAWRQLVAVLGTPNLTLQQLHGELEADDIHLVWEEALQQILCESPEIAAAMAEVQATRWAVERAHAEVIPNVEVQAVLQDDRGTGSSNANLQISLPIPILNRNQGGIRRAHAQAAAAEQAVDRIGLELQVRLADAFQRYESARNEVDAYSRDDGILDKTNRSLALVRKGYEGGEVGVQDMLSVQRTYFQTNLAYLDSLRELWVSMMEIRGLVVQGSLLGDR
jgi:cobalt-zinc-cadmium efflux system outer membrane protein